MKTQSIDTPPEVEELVVQRLRALSATERLQRALDLTAAMRALAEQRIRARYGADLQEREVNLRLASQSLDRETMIRIFDWDPEARGY